MKLRFERTGGIAGIRLAGTIDGDALTPDDRAALLRLLDGPRATAEADANSSADAFEYALTAEDGRSMRVREADASPPDRALLRKLTRVISR